MKIREMLDQLDEISRRDFLKGAGATAGLAAMGAPKDATARDRLKIAIEVGELDLDTKEYQPVRSGISRNFVYLIDSSQFGMQWVDKQGNKISEPEIFQAKGPGSDFKNRPNTMYFSNKNAVKVVPNGAPEGDLIYFTPRSWIEQKIGWRSLYFQMFSNIKEDSVDEATTPDAVARIEELVKYK